jgi:outer membrane protein assembly factor BamB
MKRIAAGLLAAVAYAQTGGGFELLGRYKGLGALVASAVGPGAALGSERLYVSYLYLDHTIDVVGVDPDSGEFQVFPNPAAGEYGARCMVAGPDGNMYLGTLPGAHFLKLDTKAGTLIDLGRPSSTEQYIWDVAFGSDDRLYGATYPQSKLVRYDPATGKLEDLGRMDSKEQYAHYVAGSSDGFMYIGIGTSKANIAAYEIRTGEHREILPADAQVVGQAKVYRAQDGSVYGSVGARCFRLSGWTATEAKAGPPGQSQNRLRDGRSVEVLRNVVKTGTSEHRYEYAGNDLPLFRVGLGPDGALYGSSVLPIHLVKLDARGTLNELGDLGGGEIYSFLSRKDRLLLAAYAGVAPLMALNAAAPFSVENPALVNFAGSDSGWRPQALINGPGAKVYIGSVAGYGKLGGPLSVWDPEQGTVQQYPHLIPDQSVVSLAVWKDRLVGGTTVAGGGGSYATQKEARLFLWNPATRQKEFDAVAVPGEKSITDLIAAPNGLVYGIAGSELFLFDPKSRTFKDRKELPFRSAIYNSVALGPDGRIWGLTADGIFAIDTRTDTVELIAKAPQKITGGFALQGNAVYFICGPAVYRYVIPK